jgi:tellurite resistance protein TerC
MLTIQTILLTISSNELIFFSVFIAFILLVLLLDLGILNRENKIIGFKEAFLWTGLWLTCAFIFFIVIRFKGHLIHGIYSHQDLENIVFLCKHKIQLNHTDLTPEVFEANLRAYRNNLSIEFLTGYFIEYALSVDNIFVILLIFNSFGVRERYFKRVLFWGVLGALIMRFLFIFLGATLIQHFSWLLYIFGAFLIFQGAKLAIKKNDNQKVDEKNHPVVRAASKIFRVFPRYIGERFFVRKDRKLWVTPLFIVLLVVEFSDVIFAVDSVPAIFAVTVDPFVVFFSNIFAIMGLRSMFFLLTNVMHLFHYLSKGLAVLLIFIGIKMCFHHTLETWGLSNITSLIIILMILGVSVALSLLFPKKASTID